MVGKFAIRPSKGAEVFGATDVRWTDRQFAAFATAWSAVVEEGSAQNEDFKRIAERCYAFRELHGT